jgi:hypothetical protein
METHVVAHRCCRQASSHAAGRGVCRGTVKELSGPLLSRH